MRPKDDETFAGEFHNPSDIHYTLYTYRTQGNVAPTSLNISETAALGPPAPPLHDTADVKSAATSLNISEPAALKAAATFLLGGVGGAAAFCFRPPPRHNIIRTMKIDAVLAELQLTKGDAIRHVEQLAEQDSN